MKKQVYQMPMVEVMNARVEKGFAGSNETPNYGGPGTIFVNLHTEEVNLAIEDCID